MKKMIALFLLVSSAAFAGERPEPRHVYRLDFVVAENDAGKAATSTTYTLNLEENHTGEIKMGTNVVLPAQAHGATMRADIGLLLRTSFTSVGEDLLVDDEVEITAAKDAQTFHKMSAKGTALVAPGKPALVASVEDPISHKHYQMTVTATKLR
jgi:hypothetical protein